MKKQRIQYIIKQTLGRNCERTIGVVQWRKQSRFDCVDPLSRNIIATEKCERKRERDREKFSLPKL